jgi:exosortase
MLKSLFFASLRLCAFALRGNSPAWLLPLAWLWYRLIDHLRIEWSVNPQYSYGWAVPLLCAYLIWREYVTTKRHDHKTSQPPDCETGSPIYTASKLLAVPCRLKVAFREGRNAAFRRQTRALLTLRIVRSRAALLFLVGLLYAPIRLIQEANPEWRFVSWSLALVVLTITFCLWASPPLIHQSINPLIHSGIHSARHPLLFPLAFFLVAVPWPTFLERPLIQALARANAAATVEVLDVLGVSAIQHGNLLEVGAGVIGIDDACSGIRSFQATLMVALFFGQLYRLSAPRRVGLCLLGFLLSFLFNVARTTLLTWVAAHKGIAAIAHWHDPAGVTILLACFLSLWLLSLCLRPSPRQSISPSLHHYTAPALPRSLTPSLAYSIPLALWLLAVEAATELWYRAHESQLLSPVPWHVELPRDNATFRELPFSQKTKQILRYDEGLNGSWTDGAGRRWQAIFIHWNAGRAAFHLAKSHTPEDCLTAAGRQVIAQSDLHRLSVHGLQLPFRSYTATTEPHPGFQDSAGSRPDLNPETAATRLNVFYCLWDDRAADQSFGATTLTYANRLAPVLAGRRNTGQRSLEVAIWGIDDPAAAELALRHELDKLVKLRD